MEGTLLIHNKSLRYRRVSSKHRMELQEGDGLMAASRRAQTWCSAHAAIGGGTRAKTIRACVEANFLDKVTSLQPTA
jgi:hypothetical protein